MLCIRNILYPTDFSPCAEAAFQHALQLARTHRATLHIMHVEPLLGVQPHPPMFESATDVVVGGNDSDGEPRKRLEALFRGHLHDVELRMAYNRDIAPASSILSYSNANDIDLIVMGSHGRRGVRRLLLGSVAEKLVRHASCPVLVVPTRSEHVKSPPSERRLLVPFDFSPSSELALQYAHELAGEYDRAIDVLHVIDPGTHVETYVMEVSERGRMLDQLTHEVQHALERIGASLNDRSVTVEHHVSVGFPPAEVVEFARDNGSSLIVLSSHGRSGKDSILIGSVAEHVIRRAPCPVFLARPFGKSLVDHRLQNSDDRATVTADD